LIKALTQRPITLTQAAAFFEKHRGQLVWPTAGKIIHRFGTRIEKSEIRRKGVEIKAPEGQAVYAIAPGRVVFSGWMSQYGLLMIIDHGKGYLSLYGHNRLLYQKVGDVIDAHTLIAKVGNTGGHKATSLYFGLWHNNKTINPRLWCLKRK